MRDREGALGKRFEEAFGFAHELHRVEARKGTRTPYIGHLLAVASLVIENGGDEDEAVAALLHDAVEDQGGRPTLEEIRRRFGERVASIVEACSDTDVIPKPPWRPRKESYLQRLKSAPPSVRLVAAADKLHNARSTLADYRREGDAVWNRFNAGKADQLWYFREATEVLKRGGPAELVEELDRVVTELERLAGGRPRPVEIPITPSRHEPGAGARRPRRAPRNLKSRLET